MLVGPLLGFIWQSGVAFLSWDVALSVLRLEMWQQPMLVRKQCSAQSVDPGFMFRHTRCFWLRGLPGRQWLDETEMTLRLEISPAPAGCLALKAVEDAQNVLWIVLLVMAFGQTINSGPMLSNALYFWLEICITFLKGVRHEPLVRRRSS